jgi:hypothetical protein
MHKYIAIFFCLFLAGCAPTSESRRDHRVSAQANPGPNLDRNYDWGSKPLGPSESGSHKRE